MGFLNVLLRRQRTLPEKTLDQTSFLKAQAYESTTASSPPILGTYPVPGNGSNPILIAANQQSLQVLLNTGDLTSRGTPLSRLRSGTLSRPGTAASTSRVETLVRPRTSSGPNLNSLAALQSQIQAQEKNSPHFRVPARDSYLPYQLPPKPWVDGEPTKRHSLNARASVISSSSSVPASIGNHRSTPSLGSRSKTHIDLLDATIKPLDFYDRLSATGFRTYGEDVADRNRPQSMASSHAEGSIEQEDVRGLRKRHSTGYSLRTSSIRPSSQLTMEPIEATRDGELITKRKANKAARRQSMPVSVSSDSAVGNGQKSRGHEVEAAVFPMSLKEKAAAMAANELAIIRATAAMPRPNRIRLDATEEASPTESATKLASSAGQSSTAVQAKLDTSTSAVPPQDTMRSAESPRQNDIESRIHRAQPRSRNVSGASLTMSSIKQLDLDNPIPDRSSSLRNWSMTSGSATAYTYDYESNPFRPQSSHTTKTSVDLTPLTPAVKGESSNQASLHSPASRSSLDHQRAHPKYPSRHTTLKKSPLGPDMGSTRSRQGPTATNLPDNEFNIDDYVSSDDSFGSPKRNRSDEEKELLFTDDSFGSMFQLPGLSKPVHREYPEPPRSMDSQTLSLNAFNAFSEYETSPSFGQVSSMQARAHRQPNSRPATSNSKRYNNFTMPSYLDDDWQEREDSGIDADSEDEWSMDIPMKRAAPMRQHHQSSPGRHYSQAHRIRIEDDFDYRHHKSARPRLDRHHQPRSHDAPRVYVRDY